MPNLLEDAFEQMLDAQERVSGERKKVVFRAVPIDALIGSQGVNDGPSPVGGVSNSATTSINLRKSDVTLPVGQHETVGLGGVEFDIISYNVLEGSIHLTIGHFEAEDQ